MYKMLLGAQAFTRCSQQEPENGEAWNNIAAIHLQLQHAPEAFSALSEAVKIKRESWQTWSNYAQAALQTGNNLPAARAVQKVQENLLSLGMPLLLENYCQQFLVFLYECCSIGRPTTTSPVGVTKGRFYTSLCRGNGGSAV